MILNSLINKNAILVSGIVIAPVVVFVNTLQNAVTLIITFPLMMLLTLLFSSFVPKNILYTIRIIIYTLIGSLIYVPIAIFLKSVMPEQITSIGIYFPMLITNSLLVARSDSFYFSESKGNMLIDIIFCIIGYDIVVFLFGLLREIISTGEVNGNVLPVGIVFKGLSMPYGGFILLGIFAAVLRAIHLIAHKFKS